MPDEPDIFAPYTSGVATAIPYVRLLYPDSLLVSLDGVARAGAVHGNPAVAPNELWVTDFWLSVVFKLSQEEIQDALESDPANRELLAQCVKHESPPERHDSLLDPPDRHWWAIPRFELKKDPSRDDLFDPAGDLDQSQPHSIVLPLSHHYDLILQHEAWESRLHSRRSSFDLINRLEKVLKPVKAIERGLGAQREKLDAGNPGMQLAVIRDMGLLLGNMEQVVLEGLLTSPPSRRERAGIEQLQELLDGIRGGAVQNLITQFTDFNVPLVRQINAQGKAVLVELADEDLHEDLRLFMEDHAGANSFTLGKVGELLERVTYAMLRTDSADVYMTGYVEPLLHQLALASAAKDSAFPYDGSWFDEQEAKKARKKQNLLLLYGADPDVIDTYRSRIAGVYKAAAPRLLMAIGQRFSQEKTRTQFVSWSYHALARLGGFDATGRERLSNAIGRLRYDEKDVTKLTQGLGKKYDYKFLKGAAMVLAILKAVNAAKSTEKETLEEYSKVFKSSLDAVESIKDFAEVFNAFKSSSPAFRKGWEFGGKSIAVLAATVGAYCSVVEIEKANKRGKSKKAQREALNLALSMIATVATLSGYGTPAGLVLFAAQLLLAGVDWIDDALTEGTEKFYRGALDQLMPHEKGPGYYAMAIKATGHFLDGDDSNFRRTWPHPKRVPTGYGAPTWWPLYEERTGWELWETRLKKQGFSKQAIKVILGDKPED